MNIRKAFMNNIITIDGPSGVGKTAASMLVARQLGLRYIPSGMLFRYAAYLLLQNKTDLKDDTQVTALLDFTDVMVNENGDILSRGEIVPVDLLNTSEIGAYTANIAQNATVRSLLLDWQRSLNTEKGCVIEGVSTGLEVFPEASLKIWLTAEGDARLERLTEKSGNEAAQDAMMRDKINEERELAPMKKAEDAVEIDTTNLTPTQVADEILRHYHER